MINKEVLKKKGVAEAEKLTSGDDIFWGEEADIATPLKSLSTADLESKLSSMFSELCNVNVKVDIGNIQYDFDSIFTKNDITLHFSIKENKA